MKKLATIFLMLTLLVSFVWAENTSQAVKRVQWSREMIKLSQPEQVKIQSKVQNALRSNSDRGKMMQVYMGKTHHERKSHKTNSHLQVFNNQMSFQRAQKSLSKFAPSKTDIMMPMDTLTLFPGVPDTINYIAGESFVCGPEGQVIARAGKGTDEILYADIDLKQIPVSPAEQHFFPDRRPEDAGNW